MDNQRFDRITKQLAPGLSRRQAMKGVAVALGLSTVGFQTFDTTAAKAKQCPSQDGSECPENQICDNQTLTCTKCDQRHFVTCKGSTGPGTCCFAENSDCCICTFTGSGATFGTCGAIGQCATLYPPDVAVCA